MLQKKLRIPGQDLAVTSSNYLTRRKYDDGRSDSRLRFPHPGIPSGFEIFLNHTDQKLKAQQWLNDLVDRLPCKDIFIDAGAGNGKVTAWFTERFGRTIAIEPNASLRSELTRACPAAEVVGEGILDAKVSAAGDLILCSYVFTTLMLRNGWRLWNSWFHGSLPAGC